MQEVPSEAHGERRAPGLLEKQAMPPHLEGQTAEPVVITTKVNI